MHDLARFLPATDKVTLCGARRNADAGAVLTGEPTAVPSGNEDRPRTGTLTEDLVNGASLKRPKNKYGTLDILKTR